MQLTYFTTLLAATTVAASSFCGTPDPTEKQLQESQHLHAIERHALNKGISLYNTTNIEIKVYFHVIAESMTERGGYMSPTVLDQQFAVLHDTYKKYNITFKLAGSEHVVNPDWAGNCKLEMKKALHNGTYADLNVYFFPRIFCIRQKRNLWSWLTLLGYFQFPDDGIVGTEAQYGDAVHVRSVTAPGGHDFVLGQHYLGTTLVHETGHWLGLWHTFQGGCTGANDMVDDTLPQVRSTGQDKKCDFRSETCPGVNASTTGNYMDYLDDVCYTNFTPGQVDRMFSQWFRYRAKYQTA